MILFVEEGSFMQQSCRMFLLVFILAATGCATQPSQWSSETPFDLATAEQITRDIRLVSDSQIHESRGTASRIFSLAGDEFISVTVRTGQQVIGSGDLLRAALADKTSYPLTLHLGDAIDVSCQTEWDYFLRVMDTAIGEPGARTWLLAPGNHDGFLVGNFLPSESTAYKRFHWNNVCNAGRASNANKQVVHPGISKDAIIASYVERLTKAARPSSSSGIECYDDGNLCIAYQYGKDPWTSYIVQLVKLPPVHPSSVPVYALMLDTSDYPSRPNIWPWEIYAGKTGNVSRAQSDAALSLLDRLPVTALFFIAGHHPYQAWKVDKWDAAARSAWNRLVDNPRFMRLLVSAHTHEGGWYEHHGRSGLLYELNLPSLSDAPLNFRSLSFERDSRGAIKVNSAQQPLTLLSGGDCSKVPEPGRGYLTSEQSSASERHGDLPIGLPYAFGAWNFGKHFFRFWEAKHAELRPQLLAYADVVAESMPPDHQLVVARIPKPFASRDHLIQRMRKLAWCDHASDCSVQEKGHILLALDDYYWRTAPQQVKDAGHQLRFCMALRSTTEAGAQSGVVARASERGKVGAMIIPAKLH